MALMRASWRRGCGCGRGRCGVAMGGGGACVGSRTKRGLPERVHAWVRFDWGGAWVGLVRCVHSALTWCGALLPLCWDRKGGGEGKGGTRRARFFPFIVASGLARPDGRRGHTLTRAMPISQERMLYRYYRVVWIGFVISPSDRYMCRLIEKNHSYVKKNIYVFSWLNAIIPS